MPLDHIDSYQEQQGKHENNAKEPIPCHCSNTPKLILTCSQPTDQSPEVSVLFVTCAPTPNVLYLALACVAGPAEVAFRLRQVAVQFLAIKLSRVSAILFAVALLIGVPRKVNSQSVPSGAEKLNSEVRPSRGHRHARTELEVFGRIRDQIIEHVDREFAYGVISLKSEP